MLALRSRRLSSSGGLLLPLLRSLNSDPIQAEYQWTPLMQPLLPTTNHYRPVSGINQGTYVLPAVNIVQFEYRALCSKITRAYSTSEANTVTEGSAETVKELYDKMCKSVEAKTMPPNAWLWSLIEKCTNEEDIKLLFDILQTLRRFRLSSLRIHDNFNCHLCHTVAKACARAGAIEYGKRTLWKHNVYGLTPSIASAHYLLLYAKEHGDVSLMVDIMKILKRNSLPLQPGTADIVFSICYATNDWDMMSKYSKRFIKSGVKLHRNAFGIWMEFAAKRGDVQCLWEIEELRAKTMNQHTVASGLACAKGYLLEGKPEDAATTIHMLNQSLPEKKKPNLAIELQKLVSEWPKDVIKKQKKDGKKPASSLKNDIRAMVESLMNMGIEVTVNLEEKRKEPIQS